MSDYQKMVKDEAKTFLAGVEKDFEEDSEEFGGQSEKANFSKWLDRTRKLFEHIDGVSKDWGRLEAEMIKTSSRNAVPYGNPKEAAYFAYYKDIVHELKRIRKGR